MNNNVCKNVSCSIFSMTVIMHKVYTTLLSSLKFSGNIIVTGTWRLKQTYNLMAVSLNPETVG